MYWFDFESIIIITPIIHTHISLAYITNNIICEYFRICVIRHISPEIDGYFLAFSTIHRS
ncbi:hypothetical protein [Lederbergia citrea]|uniref:Uncharacterized protein n=1 Tax=Lederbergia citrea TaxID=2833581 RepID=A0A942Z3F9_9BACI|nr:hypothetical protein [Lederbergia citrea]MBS4177944.1 hypothetical protein [Lederbergia citrea]MBS4223543.1 hypothetical protein [Lederbergia citrea]